VHRRLTPFSPERTLRDRFVPPWSPMVVRKRPSAVEDERSDGLDVLKYRRRLKDQGKFADRKPGTGTLDGCLHDPPKLPPVVKVLPHRAAEPTRAEDGCLMFAEHPEFRPNLSPAEVLRLGSFGGTYFRDIQSAVTGLSHLGRDVIREFPTSWFKGLDIDTMVCSSSYNKQLNKFGASCGGSLGQWESSGWISELDPYGWFQWYCRFFLGRRSTDDARQVQRWAAGQGPSGRWRSRVCNDVVRSGRGLEDETVSRVCRQVLQHWAYRLTAADLEKHHAKA